MPCALRTRSIDLPLASAAEAGGRTASAPSVEAISHPRIGPPAGAPDAPYRLFTDPAQHHLPGHELAELQTASWQKQVENLRDCARLFYRKDPRLADIPANQHPPAHRSPGDWRPSPGLARWFPL